REGLIDLALLVGTDFNQGVRGIGPKKALKLVQQYHRVEQMPPDIRDAVGDSGAIAGIRQIYLQPPVTNTYDVRPTEPDFDGIVRFLCDEREFSHDRVTAAIDRAFRERPLDPLE